MRILRVAEFLDIVNAMLSESFSGELFAVEGEVSGYRVSQGQWVTFDLKDEASLINVFLPLRQLRVPVADGMRVRVFGKPRVYPKYGKFSLFAERIELAGEGAMRKALLLLRARLEKEGLLDPARKRPLPRFPKRIALIASRESAAYGDFLRVLRERWGGLDIDLYHVLVQGEHAPQEIVAAIEAVNSASERGYDVLVLTRGGGSLEELMAFHDERVARAIHGSTIPTLVAIGHERDVTLAEEVADVRGATPTDCARRLVPDRREVLYELATTVAAIEDAWRFMSDRVTLAIERALASATHWIERLQRRLASVSRLLESLDPMNVLRRGYAIARDADGHLIRTTTALAVGNAVEITLHDGRFDAQVTKIARQRTLSKHGDV